MNWLDVLWRTSLQSSLSTMLALFLGFFLAIFVLSELSLRQRRAAFVFLLWPSMMPAYFWFMVTASKTGQSVVLLIWIQALMNMGWVAWRLQSFWSDQLSRSLELSFVEGTSWVRLLRKVLWPLSRVQILHIAVSVFLFCFSNYSLAMLLAGSSWSLDVYLVEKWREGNGILPTLSVAAGLWVVMFIFYWKIPGGTGKPQVFIERFPMLKVFWGKPLLLLLLLLPMVFLYRFFQGVAWDLFFELVPWSALFDSLLVGLVTGWILWIFGALSLWAWPSKRMNFFFSSLVSPPVSLLGLLLSLLEIRGGGEILIIALGFSLFLWPLLYRVFVAPYRDALLSQMQTASVCGASRWQTLSRVLLPQVQSSLFSMSALGAFWSIGDFSFTSLLAYETTPLAKMILEKMNRYEMTLAHAWFSWLLAVAAVTSLFFIGCAYVTNRKSAA